MDSDEQLLDFLVQAEEWQQQGRTFRVQELCPNSPELWPPLQDLLQRMKQLDRQLHVAEASGLRIDLAAPPGPCLPEQSPPVPGYEILGEIGRGGMGVVYQARQVSLQRVVALKMILAGPYASPRQRARFRHEAEIVARLRHPNVVHIYEVGEQAGVLFFVMEYVEGGSLAARLGSQPQPPRRAAELVQTLARAVHAAHQQGIIHCDLKPANVLLTPDGMPKIADFGLARRLQEQTGQTGSQIVGTASYVAPEQVRRDGARLGPATDVYALGVILYELFTGRVPHQGENTMETVLQVLEQEPVPPARLQPKLPRDLETICLKCLAKKPGRRYASAADLADDLGRWLNREPIRARPVSVLEHGVRWCQRRPAQAVLAAALLLVTLLSLTTVSWQLWRAEAAKEVAVREKETADQERSKAVRLADDLRVQQRAAQWQTYRANLAAAASALELHNTEVARRYLEEAPEQYRNWEWRHFQSQLNRSHAVLRGHQGTVNAVAFSPDGRRVASASEDRTVRLWDTATGNTLAVLEGHTRPAWQVVFSPDGRRLASWALDRTVRLWDLAGNRPLAVLRGPDRVDSCLAFSPDGRLLATLAEDGKVLLADATTGAPRRTLRQPTTRVERLAFRPDGKQLAGGGSDGTLVLWDVASGGGLAEWPGHSAGVVALGFSPDGTRLVSSGMYPDNTVRLWQATSRRLIAVLTGHRNEAPTARFSPDGSRLVSASWDQTARLWDGVTGKAIATLQGHRGQVYGAAFRPDGKRLVTCSADQALRLWDATTGELVTVLGGHRGPVHGVAFSPDGRRIASASNDQTVRLWDAELAERNGVLRGHTSYVYGVAFSPDGARVASAAWDGTVRLWDATTGRQTARLRHETQIVDAVAFSPDGRHLASLTRDAVHLWDLASGKRQHVLPGSAGAWSADARAAFNPQGTLLAVGSGDGPVRLWDVVSGHCRMLPGDPGGCAYAVAFSPDGTQLASGHRDGTVRVWSVATGTLRSVRTGHTGSVVSVCYSRDGSRIASAGTDKTVRLWDAWAQAPVAVLPHGTEVYAVAFSPDGTRLATACRDNAVHLWDVPTGSEVAELRGHADYVHDVAFSPDGTRLASASGDFTVRVWDVLPPQARAGRTP